MNIKITNKQLLYFLTNRKNSIYLLNGWLNEVPKLDFINRGKNGMTFGMNIKDNGIIEIYDFRINNKLKLKLLSNKYVIEID